MLTAVWAAVVAAAAAFVVGIGVAVYVMLKAARLMSETSAAVAGLRERGDLLIERANAAIDRAAGPGSQAAKPGSQAVKPAARRLPWLAGGRPPWPAGATEPRDDAQAVLAGARRGPRRDRLPQGDHDRALAAASAAGERPRRVRRRRPRGHGGLYGTTGPAASVYPRRSPAPRPARGQARGQPAAPGHPPPRRTEGWPLMESAEIVRRF